jgi:small subunit ribosomal protein S14
MTNTIQKDQKRRNLVSKNELKRLQYKTIITDLSIPKEIRYKYVSKLNKLSRNSCNVRIRNRCVITGRGRAVYRFCKLSRICFRELAAQGLIMGISKASW